MLPVFKNVGERSMAKNYCHVSLLSEITKMSGKLLNNRLVGHLEKCGECQVFTLLRSIK